MPDSGGGETQPKLSGQGQTGDGWTLVLYRLSEIERKLDRQIVDEREKWREYDKRMEEMSARQTATDIAVGRLSERLAISQVFQAIFTTVAGVVAGLFGRQ